MEVNVKPIRDELIAVLDYNLTTGVLTWKERGTGRSYRRGGKVAGHLRKDGYIHVQIGRRSYYAHCVIWCLVTGAWPSSEVDHIDLDRSNNSWSNLRLATTSQNAFARGNKRAARGTEILPNGKYRARVGIKGRRIHLGCFESLEDAQAAYRAKAKELFGEFARLP